MKAESSIQTKKSSLLSEARREAYVSLQHLEGSQSVFLILEFSPPQKGGKNCYL